AIVTAAEDLWRVGPGDILVFLPGEREIRETAELLRASLAHRPYAGAVEILPPYARLSVAEQQRVFAPSRGRRIVLATNVAETSLTVPGIHYVIDSGLARVRRYSLRNKVTLLQIEKIAQAAAEQRAGRCGRIAPGVCVRLYDEEDFGARPRFTDPEILRSDFLSLIALWQFFADALSEGLSHRRLVEHCRVHFVSYLRLVEWRDLYRQLAEQVRELGWRLVEKLPDEIDDVRYATIHRALLAGLLSNIGFKSEDAQVREEQYLGARDIRFFLHPGSGLAKKG